MAVLSQKIEALVNLYYTYLRFTTHAKNKCSCFKRSDTNGFRGLTTLTTLYLQPGYYFVK